MKKPITKAAACFIAASMLTAVSAAAQADDKKPSRIPYFKEVPFPISDADKPNILASDQVTVDGKTHKIGFNSILRSGEVKAKRPLTYCSITKASRLQTPMVRYMFPLITDFSSLLPIGNKLFMVSHFESRPGTMYLTELNQAKDTGKLTAVSTKNIDFSSYGGYAHRLYLR